MVKSLDSRANCSGLPSGFGTYCVALGKFLNLSVLLFPHCKGGVMTIVALMPDSC